MNITQFAEQIVFGKTLEDKLLVPGKLTHDLDYRGPNVESLLAPGRPGGLEMQHAPGSGAQAPSDELLENEQARGQLLHFLANHELLATELMALVLLKFPDAPHAFRQGVLVTLQEEQEHTRMYIARMKECGVEFGSFPVSGQFWRIVEPMQSPMDFVSRLSLTFEQANLDYSLHFANVFKRIGDDDTAKVLQKIYEDEIGHVQHGLQWFRQWKNPEQSDWEAYQDSLEFPMSPQRGRGPRASFNRAGRSQAGLTDDFIDAIEVFRQSRGRAPTVRWFDPASETLLSKEIPGNENFKTSDKTQHLMNQLGQDLELVMVALAKQDDVLLVQKVPSRELRKQLIDCGFDLPEIISMEDRDKLTQRKLHDFSPWAWTPRNHQTIEPLLDLVRHAPPVWKPENVELFTKSWGARQLGRWLSESDTPNWFTGLDCVGEAVHDIEDISKRLKEFQSRGYENAIFKQDLSASGRGQRRLSCTGGLDEKDLAWLESGPVVGVVEPELNRLLDLSFLWHLPRDSQAPNYLGWTRPLIAPGRRYEGTRLGSPLSDPTGDCIGDDERLKRFLLADRGARLQRIADWLESKIAEDLLERKFEGYFGIDALVCADAEGELKVKPLVELNPRMTMGHVALNLKKRLAPGVEAEFRILTRSQLEPAEDELRKMKFTRSRDGRWVSGAVWLGEVSDAAKLVPVVLVGDEAIDAIAHN